MATRPQSQIRSVPADFVKAKLLLVPSQQRDLQRVAADLTRVANSSSAQRANAASRLVLVKEQQDLAQERLELLRKNQDFIQTVALAQEAAAKAAAAKGAATVKAALAAEASTAAQAKAAQVAQAKVVAQSGTPAQAKVAAQAAAMKAAGKAAAAAPVQAPVNRSYVAQQVKAPRKPLVLPRTYSVPSSATTKLIAQKIVAKAPKIAGETKAQTAIRQKELVKRALVRAILLSKPTPIPAPASSSAYTTTSAEPIPVASPSPAAVIEAAVAQTIQQDAQVIATEVQVAGPAGGVAPDQTADQMAPVVEAAVVEAQMDASGESSSGSGAGGLLMAGAAAALGLFAYTRGWIG